MTLYRNRVTSDKLKLRRGHIGFQVSLYMSREICTRDIDIQRIRPLKTGRDWPEWCFYKSRSNKDCSLPSEGRRSKEGVFLRALRRNMALPTPWRWTSSLQNLAKIKFCCFKLVTHSMVLCFSSPRKIIHWLSRKLVDCSGLAQRASNREGWQGDFSVRQVILTRTVLRV